VAKDEKKDLKVFSKEEIAQMDQVYDQVVTLLKTLPKEIDYTLHVGPRQAGYNSVAYRLIVLGSAMQAIEEDVMEDPSSNPLRMLMLMTLFGQMKQMLVKLGIQEVLADMAKQWTNDPMKPNKMTGPGLVGK